MRTSENGRRNVGAADPRRGWYWLASPHRSEAAGPRFSRACVLMPALAKPTSGRGGTQTTATILGKTGGHHRTRRRIRPALRRIGCNRCRSPAAHYPRTRRPRPVYGKHSFNRPHSHLPEPLEGPLRAIDLEVLHTPIGVCRRQEFAHTPPGCNKYPWLSAK